MAKDLKLSIVIGLKNRATKGLQAIGGQVKSFSSGLTASLGSSNKLFGAAARGMDGLGAVATAVAPELGIPFMVLGTGVKAALSGVAAVGGLVTRVFKGIGSAILAAARIGIRAFEGLTAQAMRLVKVLGMVSLAAGAAMAWVAKSSLDAAMQMEGFQAKLTTATKSGTLGKAWMDWAVKFAAQTPFQVNEVVDAATRLLLQGFNPAELLTNIGNMAGAMNKPVTDAVEAYLDATRGEWERIKEFGINPRNLKQYGAKMAPQGGIDAQTEEGAARAKSALDALLKARYGGGMAQMMKTSAGQISNLEDAVFQLKVTIGNMLLPVLKSATEFGQKFVAWLDEMKVGERVGAWLALTGERILWFGKAIAYVVQQVAGGATLGEAIKSVIGEGFGEGAAKTLGPAIDNIIGAVQRFWTAITTVFNNLTAGVTGDPAGFIAGIVNGIAAAITWLTDNVFAPGRIAGIVGWFKGLAAVALNFAGLIVAGIQYGVAKLGGLQAIIAQVGGYFKWLLAWGKYLVGWVYTNLPNMLSVVGSTFAAIANAILNLVEDGIYLKATWGVIFHVLGVVATGAAAIVGAALLTIGKVLEGLFWGLSKIPGLTDIYAPVKDGMKQANDAILAFTQAAGLETDRHMKQIVSSVTDASRDIGRINLAKQANEKFGAWTQKQAEDMRKTQASWGLQVAPKPGELKSYLPPDMAPTAGAQQAGINFRTQLERTSASVQALGTPAMQYGGTGMAQPATQVTNNYYVQGNGDTFLLGKIRELTDQQRREDRWAPAG